MNKSFFIVYLKFAFSLTCSVVIFTIDDLRPGSMQPKTTGDATTGFNVIGQVRIDTWLYDEPVKKTKRQ